MKTKSILEELGTVQIGTCDFCEKERYAYLKTLKKEWFTQEGKVRRGCHVHVNRWLKDNRVRQWVLIVDIQGDSICSRHLMDAGKELEKKDDE